VPSEVRGKELPSYVDSVSFIDRLVDQRGARLALQPRLGLLSERSTRHDSRNLSCASTTGASQLMKYVVSFTLLALSPLVYAVEPETGAQKRVVASAEVLSDILHAKDRGVPEDLIAKAQCVGIVPSLKRAGFIVGAKYGKGVVVCRTNRGWSAPATIRIEGGSFGFQIGAGETDLVFIVMNRHGVRDLMKDKFTLGGDATAMAGPVGRSGEAQTDALMRAEILSYSRAHGIFAGVSLEGSTLRPDNDDNRELYGRHVTQTEILSGQVARPAVAQPIYAELGRYAIVKRASK
jgi:lipid-binding SYLF domain-containing protein